MTVSPKCIMSIIPLAVLSAACAAPADREAADETESTMSVEVADADPTPTVVLETTKGRIVIELNRTLAPRSVNNFVTHVNLRFYNGLMFHRVMPNFMIQAGLLTADLVRRSSPAAFVQNESDNGLLNVRGAVSMARGRDPHSAKTEFFINVVDNPVLDPSEAEWGYAVFGKVIEGMDVVDVIRAVETGQRGRFEDVPLEPVVIDSAYVHEGDWPVEGGEGTN